jgi:hypothetical protein
MFGYMTSSTHLVADCGQPVLASKTDKICWDIGLGGSPHTTQPLSYHDLLMQPTLCVIVVRNNLDW